MSETATQEFGKWRSRIWPIYNYELKKILPMIIMFFLILYNYTVLRDSKDTMLVQEVSNLAIPFVKIFGTSLAAIFFLIIYSKLSNILSKPKLFYMSVAPFMGFFALFALVLYPNASSLEPTALSNWIQGLLPEKLAFIADIVRKWPYPLFYVIAELWGTVCISLLFWGFANDITRVSEAKRAYPILGLFGNVGLILAGETVHRLSHMTEKMGLSEKAAYGLTLNYLMAVLIGSALAIIGIYWWMNKYVLSDPRFNPEDGAKLKKKKKPKLSMMESFKYLASSRYLLCIAIIVLGYGMAINLIEVTWKGQLMEYFSTKNQYSAFMGSFSKYTGIVTMFCMLFVGGNVVRRFGWTKGALFTPVMLLVTGIIFFSVAIFREQLSPLALAMGTTPIFLSVVIGAGQNILTKASKYALFDPTKEMTYIPLDQEQKVKGKAAIDVAGARLGKSGGSVLNIVLAGAFGAAGMVPAAGVLTLGVVIVWATAAKSLGKRFADLTEQRAREDEEKEAAVAETEAAPA